LYKYDKYFYSHELQFGFKSNFGCSSALFGMQQVVKYFRHVVAVFTPGSLLIELSYSRLIKIMQDRA